MNKGFTLIEMLFVILCLALFNLLYLNTYETNSIKSFVNVEQGAQDIIKAKLESMYYLETRCIQSDYIANSYNLCFNKRGNINQANTLSVLKSKKQIVVHLGAGVYEVK